jgi:hypothetical protein
MVTLFFIKQIDIKTTGKSPLDYLLQSVALCIGSEIQEFFQDKQNNIFSKAEFHFGNETIKIVCYCSEEFIKHFQDFTEKCYILKNLKFKHDIAFK